MVTHKRSVSWIYLVLKYVDNEQKWCNICWNTLFCLKIYDLKTGKLVFFGKFMYYLKHAYRSVLSDIKREAQPSVLYLIKHDYKCFKWLKK